VDEATLGVRVGVTDTVVTTVTKTVETAVIVSWDVTEASKVLTIVTVGCVDTIELKSVLTTVVGTIEKTVVRTEVRSVVGTVLTIAVSTVDKLVETLKLVETSVLVVSDVIPTVVSSVETGIIVLCCVEAVTVTLTRAGVCFSFSTVGITAARITSSNKITPRRIQIQNFLEFFFGL
jgi:hypothetical protein